MAGGFDFSEFFKNANEATARAVEAARHGLDVFGEHVIGDAQQLTPRDTGALQGSGTGGEPAKVEGSTISKEIGFNTEYAAAVHERLDVNHPQGQAKFLETAMRNNATKFEAFVGAEVKKVLD